MKHLLTALLLSSSLSVFAQGTQYAGNALANLDVSNINPTILTGGDAFQNLMAAGFEVPRGSGKHTIYGGALWLGGKDNSGQIYVSSQTYRQNNQAGYWPGPIANSHTPSHNTTYDKIWKVSKAQIQNHIQNYNNSGYTVPQNIATWPGNGNTTNGEAAKLAPFVDLNNDGIYSPAQGDYPDIKGDQALYLILNDKGGVKVPSSPNMNVEVHAMYYGFDMPANPAIYNTLFCQYHIINRGQLNFNNFYAGIWSDLDLGNYSDDYVGCDTTTNRYYAYNGDLDDEGPDGYGLNPPVQSVQFLNKKMSHFIYYNNSNNPINGNPQTATDYYNYLTGSWKNNTPLTYGGDGTNLNSFPFNYMFPGGLTGWSEANPFPGSGSSPNNPGDRRGLGSIGPFNLPSGQELNFTVAYTFSRGNGSTNNITVAQQDANTVQNFFNNIMGTTKPVLVKESLQLFPNPANDQLNIQLPSRFSGKKATVQISDYLGRDVLTTEKQKAAGNLTLDISSLSKGVYLVKVTSENQVLTTKLVKQ